MPSDCFIIGRAIGTRYEEEKPERDPCGLPDGLRGLPFRPQQYVIVYIVDHVKGIEIAIVCKIEHDFLRSLKITVDCSRGFSYLLSGGYDVASEGVLVRQENLAGRSVVWSTERPSGGEGEGDGRGAGGAGVRP